MKSHRVRIFVIGTLLVSLVVIVLIRRTGILRDRILATSSAPVERHPERDGRSQTSLPAKASSPASSSDNLPLDAYYMDARYLAAHPAEPFPAEPTFQPVPHLPAHFFPNKGSLPDTYRIRVHVSEQGHQTMEMVRGTGNAKADRLLLAQLDRWQWRPATKRGKPVDCTVMQTIAIEKAPATLKRHRRH
jgi:hypothetical protein